ncbi:MAG: hydantoinase/oxoprolinase family protein [Verrucomicrobia bacterium]|nr:hydantoinase/oxoprolinase family protein [Verrucomicrobiota bacterium]
MIIGIDIGGTHTDGVLVQGRTVVKSCKLPTTFPLEKGVAAVLKELVVDPSLIQEVVVGTTHATNAILEARGLLRVGVLRIAGQGPAIEPCLDWPNSLVQAVFVGCETIGGGFHVDGRELTPFSLQEAQKGIERLLEKGAEAMAVVGLFSPLCADQERAVGELLAAIPHTLSHRLGGMGFLERENAALLNSALKRCLKEGFADLKETVRQAGIETPLWMTQNNGTLISLEEAIELPVLTLCAGPTNSFVGAAHLAQLQDAVIVDIGGTSTDIGVVQGGFARRSLNQSEVGGVRLSFPMPDVLSLSVGGGSLVSLGETPQIGPRSCASELLKRSQSFGGSELTLTDLALHLGHLRIQGARSVSLKGEDVERAFGEVLQQIQRAIQRAEIGKSDLPIVVVGGGASLMPAGMGQRYVIPPHAGAANAYGAALAEVSGQVDTVISLEQERHKKLEELQQLAIDRAVSAGALRSAVRIAHMEVVSYSYMPGGMARVSLVAAGARA